MRPVGRPGLSPEQKIMVLVRRYRAAQRRHKQKEAARSKRLRMAALLAFTGLLLPTLVVLFSHSSASGAQAVFDREEGGLWLSSPDTTAAANLRSNTPA
jgi:hypothetical protein